VTAIPSGLLPDSARCVALHGYGKGNRLSVLAVAGTFEAGEPARGVE
jgi:hypothetical protein